MDTDCAHMILMHQIYCVGVFAQELAEVRRDALDDRVNGVAQLAFQQSGLDIALGVLAKINLMLATTAKFKRRATTPG